MLKQVLVRRTAAALLGAVLTVSAGSAFAADASSSSSSGRTFPGITAPSEQRGLNFNVPGVVSKVSVKEGDAVKKGDLVAEQDDRVEQAELFAKHEEIKASALQIDAARAQVDQAKVELTRSEKMFKQKVLGESELEKAKLEVVIGEIRVKLAAQESDQKKAEAKAIEAKIAQKKVFSTIDGVVQKVNVHEGELATNDPKTPCMQVVLNEPLYVEFDPPVSIAKTFTLHQKLEVKYAGDTDWQPAEVIYFNPVANAAAGSQRVRLQLDNAPHARSGLQIEVKLADKVALAPAAR